jgi:hypothetical protein
MNLDDDGGEHENKARSSVSSGATHLRLSITRAKQGEIHAALWVNSVSQQTLTRFIVIVLSSVASYLCLVSASSFARSVRCVCCCGKRSSCGGRAHRWVASGASPRRPTEEARASSVPGPAATRRMMHQVPDCFPPPSPCA